VFGPASKVRAKLRALVPVPDLDVEARSACRAGSCASIKGAGRPRGADANVTLARWRSTYRVASYSSALHS
jgi:hypothetical protein